MRISDWSSDVCSSDLRWQKDTSNLSAQSLRPTSCSGEQLDPIGAYGIPQRDRPLRGSPAARRKASAPRRGGGGFFCRGRLRGDDACAGRAARRHAGPDLPLFLVQAGPDRCRPGSCVRSDESRVGKECVSKCGSWWSAYHSKKKNTSNNKRQNKI